MLPANQRSTKAKESHSSHGFLPPGNLLPFFLVTGLFFLWGSPQ